MSNFKSLSVLKRTGGNCPGGTVRVGFFNRRELFGREVPWGGTDRGDLSGVGIYLEPSS